MAVNDFAGAHVPYWDLHGGDCPYFAADLVLEIHHYRNSDPFEDAQSDSDAVHFEYYYVADFGFEHVAVDRATDTADSEQVFVENED